MATAAPSSRLSLSSVGINTSGSEGYYKSNLDLVLKENKQLKQRLDQLEKENRGLKKAVYDLSVRHGACIEQLGRTAKPFDIDNIINPESSSSSSSLLPEILLPETVHHHVPDHHGLQKVGLTGNNKSFCNLQFSQPFFFFSPFFRSQSSRNTSTKERVLKKIGCFCKTCFPSSSLSFPHCFCLFLFSLCPSCCYFMLLLCHATLSSCVCLPSCYFMLF
jgi:hypothetical protein